jgi:GAF domain-containing protein/HAMP domain-containing protein
MKNSWAEVGSMSLLKRLTLRTKLIGSFLLLVLMAGIVSFIGVQLSLSDITEDAVPSLEITGRMGTLVKTLQAEALEFVATGEEETVEQFEQTLGELNGLSEQLVELADDAGELEGYQNLAEVVAQTGEKGNEVIQSHQQTRESLETLEATEAEAAEVLHQADAVVQAEIVRNLQDEDVNELVEDSLPSQRLFNQFNQRILDLQHEVLEFVASGEEEAVEGFEETSQQLSEVRQNLLGVLEPDEPGEVELGLQLDDIAERVEGAGQGVLESRAHTLELLEEFEELEGQLNEAIIVAQQFANQDAQAAIATANRNNLIFSLILLILAGFMGLVITNNIVKPIDQLVAVARRLGAGDFGVEAQADSQDEIGQLAQNFNTMAQQLRTSFDTIEQRTHSLELAAAISEHFSGVLNLETLLVEVVSQVKNTLDYYHVHIYLLDEQTQRLVVAEGTGSAGAEMKAQGHSIPLDAPTSLVARAARSGQIVKVDNVREAVDWLPNPLLPDTYSEMAVPIILEEKVVGVLDVQQDKVAGLDEGDINLLRTLANQVAVAIRNSYQFAEVETALAEAREAQSRYMEQAWKQIKTTQQTAYYYQRPGVLPLSETIIVQLENQVMTENQPTIIEVKAKDDEQRVTKAEPEAENLSLTPESQTPEVQSQTALIAPIRLQNQTIGMLQLHETEYPRHWSERELALVEAITEQIAQTAESLRLFDETRERAGREQTIREITDKLRAAPSLDLLLETAARELGQRLGVRHTILELGIETEKNGGLK